jgi:hypothetical protein
MILAPNENSQAAYLRRLNRYAPTPLVWGRPQ